MMILSLVALRFNSSVLSTMSIEVQNKVYLTAFSLADDMIEEIKGKAFDEATIQFPTATGNLTLPGNLGPETGEVYPYYDDVDDYNGYSKSINAPHAENYKVICSVCYVSGLTPGNTYDIEVQLYCSGAASGTATVKAYLREDFTMPTST